ncbi:hypothetical protein [Streptomyces sp. NPDC093225]
MDDKRVDWKAAARRAARVMDLLASAGAVVELVRFVLTFRS